MTHRKQLTLATLALAAVLPLAAAPPVVRDRQHAQQARIAQGVRSGELTARETARLERQQTQIRRTVRRDRVDGGAFTPAERAKAQRLQNQASRDIARQKHDAQTRR